MVNLFRAEWLKVTGNRLVAAGLIWIFPSGAVAVLVLMTLIALFGSPEARQSMGIASVDTGVTWTGMALSAWGVPNDIFFGRFVLVAFTAVIFAGEYQWGTLKNTVPRSDRVRLILTKFVTLGAFIVVAFGLMSIILSLGMAIPVGIAGGTYGPPLGGEVVRDFLGDYTLQAATAFVATIIAAGYAALAAMITRSVLGSVVAGIMTVFVFELGSFAAFAMLGMLLGKPEIIALYQLTPTYNLGNITSLISQGIPFDFGTEAMPRYAEPNSLGLSIFILAVWVVGLVGVTAYLFRKQDITS